MAPERRTSGGDIIFIGRQTKRGTYITGDNVFQPTPTGKGNLIKRRFPFIRNTLDPTAETQASESIFGDNTAAPDSITSRGAEGEWEFEVRPDDFIHLMYGWFNPQTEPSNTAIISRGTDGTIPAGKITVATAANGKQHITIDNDGNSPPIADKWPGQLKIKFPDSGQLDGSGTITIYGEQRRSRSNNFNSSVQEIISTTATALEGADGITLKKFYRRVNRMVLSGFSAFAQTTEKPTLTFLPDTQKASLVLNALNNLFAGWSAQMLKASTPYIAYDIVPNSFRLTVSGTSMRLTLTLLASYVQEGRVLLKPLEVAYKLPLYDRPETGKTELANYETTASSQTDQKKVLENFGFNNYEHYPANGTAVALGEPGQSLEDLVTAVEANTATVVAITDIEIAGTHNYTTDQSGYTGDPISGEPVTGENQTREVTVNATIIHETDQEYSDDNKTVFWQDRYFEGQEIPIIVRNYHWESDGRQDLIETRFAKCRLTEVPGLPIEGQGQASRTLAFGAFPTGKGQNDQIALDVYSKSGFSEA